MSSGRVIGFVTIGAAGFVVQMGLAATLLALGLTPALATLLAIEAAIVSNHAWHRRWAWQDRAGSQPWPLTLMRAHLGNGGTSLLVGMGTVLVGISFFGEPRTATQVVSIALIVVGLLGLKLAAS